MKIVALLGKDGGKCKEISDIPIIVPSNKTARIQEAHIMIGHVMCDIVEKELFCGSGERNGHTVNSNFPY